MSNFQQYKEIIQQTLPDAEVYFNDLTGGGDHLEAVVISSAFDGKTKVKQHQMVYSALKDQLATETIHALALKTYTPDAWQTVASHS